MNENERYRAKLEARASGKTPVFVEPPKVSQGGIDQASIDRRYREKLEQRGALMMAARGIVPAAAPSESESDKPKGETEAERKKRERETERAKQAEEAERLKAEEKAATEAKAKADADAKAKEADELAALEKATRPDSTTAQKHR